MNKILKISFDKKNGSLAFESSSDLNFKGSITVSDVYIKCVYYLWHEVDFCRSLNGWIIPLSEKLMDVILKSNNYPGFSFNIYGPNNRLIQCEKFYLNNVEPILNYPFTSPTHDAIGASYVDFFYSDLCKGIDFSGVVLDAGANVGFFTLLSKIKGSKRIYSLEPDPEAFEYLHQNFRQDSRIICLNKALSDTADVSKFSISLGSSVSSTLSKYNFQSEVYDLFVETISIPYILSIEDTIDLVKLDIEGAEYDVLKNMSKYYYKKIKQFFIEFHGNPKYIFNKLIEEGFQPEYRDSDENSSSGFIYAKRI